MSASPIIVEPLDFHTEVNALVAASGDWGSRLIEAVRAALAPGIENWWLAALAVVVIGWVAERVMCFRLGGLNERIVGATAKGWLAAAGFGLLRLAFDVVGALIFYAVAWLALYFLVDPNYPAKQTLVLLLGAALTFRLVLVVVRAILAPRAEGIRPFPLSNADALSLYRGVMVFAGAYIGVVFVWESVFSHMAPAVLGRATGVLVGIGLTAVLVTMVWSNRRRLEALFADSAADDGPRSPLATIFSQSWPYIFAIWCAMLWVNWSFAVFTLDAQREKSAMLSWWITLLFPAIDRLVHVLLTKMVGSRFVQGSGFEARRERFVATVQTCLRAILIGVALIAMALNWNLLGADLIESALGEQVIRGAVEIGLIALVAYVIYEVVMSVLEKYMPQDDPDGELEVEGEGGGAGATREETLAPLLRALFLIVLGLVVVLTVLSALGVQVLPLIAGASIVGVAIGFGSQKLVQDVISGVFFLVDDAFRRGEYIDVGEVKGTVEKISVRSMQLRHHMGALHTIPFGEVRHLTNYSRDWVMMKLKLRLTYDTDVERVRKLIKKLGLSLLDDPELGPMFLQPLKSQGVYSMEDDSAMIVRVKFMTRPGEQFVVRKAVFAKIRDLFEREGIEFAHRIVKVQLDGKAPEELTEDERRRVAGAALGAAQP